MRLRPLVVTGLALAGSLGFGASAASADWVYAGDASSGLLAFESDSATGALTAVPGSPFASGQTENGVIATPDGRRVYATGYFSATVNGFATSTAGLLPLIGSPFAVGGQPTVPALSADGRFLYVPTGAPDPGDINGYRVDPSSGALTQLPGFPLSAGLGPWAAAADPTGSFLALTLLGDSPSAPGDVVVYRVDADTGALSEVPGSPFAAGIAPAPLVFTPDGRHLYVGNGEDETISAYDVDPGTGALTPLAGSPYPSGLSDPAGLDTTPDGRFLYVANHTDFGPDKGITAFAIDPSTGALDPLTPASYLADQDPGNVVVGADGRYLYMGDGKLLRGYAIDQSTGALTEVVGSPYTVTDSEVFGLAVAPTPPPFPFPPPPAGADPTTAAPITTPAPPVPPVGQPLPAAAPPRTKPRLASSTFAVDRRGRATVRLACPAPSGTTCRFAGQLTRREATLGRVAGTVPGGTTAALTIRLNAAGQRELRRHRRLSATLTLRRTMATAALQARVTLKSRS